MATHAMRYIRLAGLDQALSVIGLGTATRVFAPTTYLDLSELLEVFLEAGGNCLDTAHIYGFGNSEKTLGRWFTDSGRRAEVVLITKGCHPAVDPHNLLGKPWQSRLTPAALHADLSESLERLQTEYVDLYLLHRDDETVPVGPLIEALNQEQVHGRLRAFGASNWRVERIAEANAYATQHGLNGFVISSPSLSLPRPVKLYYPGTLFADETTLEWHRLHQWPLLAWSALAGGFVSGRFRPADPTDDPAALVYASGENFERVRRAQALAARKNVTAVQIGLAYVLHQDFPVVALIGPTTVSHLNDALGALNAELTRAERHFLDLTLEHA